MTEKPFYKTDSFRKLQDKWYKKLEETGYRDIEYRVDGEPADYMVGPNPEYFIRRYSPDKEEYYRLARHWLFHLKESDVPREVYRIWDLHSEGKSYNEIVKALSYGRFLVSKTVLEQKKAMLKAVRHAEKPFDTLE